MSNEGGEGMDEMVCYICGDEGVDTLLECIHDREAQRDRDDAILVERYREYWAHVRRVRVRKISGGGAE